MWPPEYSADLTLEAVGLVIGLIFLLFIGTFWWWACDLIDTYPEAFGLTDERTSRGPSVDSK